VSAGSIHIHAITIYFEFQQHQMTILLICNIKSECW